MDRGVVHGYDQVQCGDLGGLVVDVGLGVDIRPVVDGNAQAFALGGRLGGSVTILEVDEMDARGKQGKPEESLR